jgi:molybdopterin-guanine dinucleotide biosynthesis protein A
MRIPTFGIVLAGGLARRMGGGDKTLLRLGGRTLLDHVVRRLAPQCGGLAISANGDPSRFAFTGLPVLSDSIPDHPGPLAGILAGLEWVTAHRREIEWVVSVPGDTPFIPDDFVNRLHEAQAASGGPIACAMSNGQEHPALGLWPVHLKDNLRKALALGGIRQVRSWSAVHGVGYAHWSAEPFDPFLNINRPDDLRQAEDVLARLPAQETASRHDPA